MLNSRLQVPRHLASKLHTYPSVASFVAFFACGTKFTYCERSLVPRLISSVRARERAWVQGYCERRTLRKQGYESVCFLAQHSFLHVHPRSGSTKHKRSDEAGQFGTPWQLTSHQGWTLTRGSPPCNRPPSIFGRA